MLGIINNAERKWQSQEIILPGFNDSLQKRGTLFLEGKAKSKKL